MRSLTHCTTNKPLVFALSLAGNGNILTRLSLKITTLIPVDSYILDKLEGICILLIVLWDISCHLQWTVHRNIQCQLTSQGRVDMMMLTWINLVHIALQDTRGIIHRTTLQTSERQYSGMESLVACERLILCTTSRLIAYQVRIGTTKTCRACCLMSIDHDMVLGSLGYAIKIVIVEPLTIVMLATRNDVTYISALHRIVTILIHQVIGSLQMTLIITHRS